MIFRVLLALILFPLLDLILLGWIARAVSWEWLAAWILATAMLGAWVIRRTGLQWSAQLRQRTARGEPLGGGVLDQLTIVLAGVLLILPGVLGDLLGLLLLVPIFRRMAQLWVIARLISAGGARRGAGDQPSGSKILDVKVLDPRKPKG